MLTAFQNVADTLNALQQDADGSKAAAAARHASRVTLDLATGQFQSGYVNNLALLLAEQAYQQALLTLVQARANRYPTSPRCLRLGGGWWNRADFPGSEVAFGSAKWACTFLLLMFCTGDAAG